MDYIQNTPEDVRDMLAAAGIASIDDLFSSIPDRLRLKRGLNLPAGSAESDVWRELTDLGKRNVAVDSRPCFLGAGFYSHYIPSVVEHLPSRGEFLTSYTPYQAEASQGTLQAIFEYQTMICELTGMDVSNASHYEGPTACAEAIAMALEYSDRNRVVLAGALHPWYIGVAETYFRHLGVEFVRVPASADGTVPPDALRQALEGAACLVVQNPNFLGCVEDLSALSSVARDSGAVSIAVVNPISLGLLAPPGACGFDIAVGDGQPLGVEITLGGPTFGFMAVRRDFIRKLPGRIVGQTVDAEGKRAFVLTLQAREQHIRREKASSNICTNQALIALRATIYLAGIGRTGLPKLAEVCTQKAHYLEQQLARIPGVKRPHAAPFFHEFVVTLPKPAAEVNRALLTRGFIGGAALDPWMPELKNAWLLCCTEQQSKADIDAFAAAVAEVLKS